MMRGSGRMREDWEGGWRMGGGEGRYGKCWGVGEKGRVAYEGGERVGRLCGRMDCGGGDN